MLLLITAAAGTAFFALTPPLNNAELTKYAERILEACATSSRRQDCYDKEIPKLMASLSMEKVFEVTKIVQEKDQNYWYCHVLGHELSARETAEDPSRWKEVVARCPLGMCSNGCLHGAFQERFRTDAMPDADIPTLTKELEGICTVRPNWKPTGMERATCYHALGHLAMYVTAAETKKSLALCDAISQKENAEQFLQICYDGVFMQIFQPLEPEDFALVKGKQPAKEELRDFCLQFIGVRQGSCWSEGWPLYLQEIVKPDGLMKFCSTPTEPREQNRCFSAMFYVLTATQWHLDENRINAFCGKLPKERQGQCFANAASRAVETDARLADKSAAICSLAVSAGVADECYNELLVYSTYNFHIGSKEFFDLCNRLPEPWNTQCLAKSKK